MKTLKIFSLGAFCLALTSLTFAQSTKESFKVSGNCSMCKKTIEKAAKDGGAKTAVWNEDSKELTITYNSSSTNTARIQQKIANAGYDNIGFTASTEAYNKLHSCCQYERQSLGNAIGVGAKCGADCHKDGKCEMATCKDQKMDCCKDMKACQEKCKDGKMECCKDGKCEGKTDCCKKS
jgi:mercuric ion binding protein